MAPVLIPESREEENTPSSNPRKCPCKVVAQFYLSCATCTWIKPSMESGIKAMAAQRLASRISVLFQSNIQAGYFIGLSAVD